MKCMARLLCHGLASIAIVSPAWADAVWHCSRNAQSDSQVQELSSIANQFAIASLNGSAEVIGISVRDLIDIYTGTPVRVSGLPMSACFSLDDDGLTGEALRSLGISQGVIQSLSVKVRSCKTICFMYEMSLKCCLALPNTFRQWAI